MLKSIKWLFLLVLCIIGVGSNMIGEDMLVLDDLMGSV